MEGNIIEKLLVSLGFEIDNASVSNVTSAIEKTKKNIEETKKASESTSSSVSQLGGVIKKALGFAGVSLSVAGLVAYGKSAIEAASTAEQMEEKFEAVFLNLSDEADAWAENLANSIGRSKNSIKTYLADQQNLLVGFGMERDAAMELSEEMTSAAINIASFNNIEDDDAVNAMSKALMGETESAKRLGAVLNDNTIAMAMEDLGYQQKFTDLDEATKMQVRFHSIVMQSPDAFREENGVIGDAALSMNTYESRLRQFNATMSDIKTNIGKFILPYAAKILEYISKAASAVRKLTEKMGDANQEGTAANKVLKTLDSLLQKITSVAKKVVSVGKTVVSFVGGAENAIKLLTGTIGGLVALKAIDKIKDMAKGLSLMSAKSWLAVVGMLALVLAIDDFVGFMNGKESVTGHFLDYLGIDQDEAREQISSIGDTLSSYFESAVDTVKDLADAIGDAVEGISEFFGYQDSASMFKDVVVAIAEAFKTIGGVALIAAGVLEQFTGNDRFSDFTTVNTRNHGYVRMSKDDAEEYQEKSLTPSAESQERAAEIEDYWASKNYSDTSQADGLFEKGISMIFGSWNRIFGTNFDTTTDETITSYSQYDDDVFEEAKKQIEDSANTASNAADTTVKNSEKSTTGIYAMADAGQSAFDKMRYMVDQGTSAFSSLSLLPDILTSSINKNAVIYQNNSITNNVSSTGDAAKLTTKQQKSANLGLETAVAGD